MLKLPGPVVSAEWLADHLDQVRIVDVRWAMDSGPKLDEFHESHLPGAVFADLDVDLSAPPGAGGRHPLPTAEAFAEARSRLGLVSKPVIAYDDHSGSQAARLWWMLDAIGHPAAVLDGGIEAWGGTLEAGEAGEAVAVGGEPVDPVPWPEDRFIAHDQIQAAIAAGAVLVDARSADRFAGLANPIDARPGHIPGSVSRPWTDNVGRDGLLLPAERLSEELSAIGVSAGSEVIASCGSGVTGCHDLLAARLAGVDGGRLYVGSWSEWSQDPERPVARSED